MDFDIIPDTVFLRIFDYLPLTDRIRVGRVSQSFIRISQIVNGRIKSLNLADRTFAKLDDDQFEVILRLCHHSLRELKFGGLERHGYLAAKFSEFTCPELVDLDLNSVPITDDEFQRIVSNHPNLKRLKWCSINRYDEDEYDQVPTLNHVEFPPVTLPHLETLHIADLNDATLERLIDRCPNLKSLEMGLDQASSEDIWDRFFRSVPHLESLQLELFNCPILMENLEWFWRLPLTSLVITYQRGIDEFMVNDDFVYKLVENFTNIDHLNLWLEQASDDAVAALSGLENLRVAKLCLTNTDFTDEVIRELAACRQLEELNIYASSISDQTFLDQFNSCPRLHKLCICGVFDQGGDIDAETAGMLLLELANMTHRPSITIEFDCATYEYGIYLQSVWNAVQVQIAVQHLKQNHGIEVTVRYPYMPQASADEGMVQGDMEAVENGDDQAMDVIGN